MSLRLVSAAIFVKIRGVTDGAAAIIMAIGALVCESMIGGGSGSSGCDIGKGGDTGSGGDGICGSGDDSGVSGDGG
ncbi:hypothetical protein Tco_1240534, partial [Tanacetum coccineum]